MRVELYIRGELFKEWIFDLVEFYEPHCPVVHDERKQLFDRVMESCIKEVDPIVMAMPHQFELIVPARVQPADIDVDEYEAFLPVVIEIENRLKIDYERS